MRAGEEEPIPDRLRGLVLLHRANVRSLKGMSEIPFTDAEAFWASFALACLYPWNQGSDAEVEVRLSEFLLLQLSLYCEEVEELDDEERQRLLGLLEQKYHRIREGVWQENCGDYGGLAWRLSRAIFEGTKAEDTRVDKMVAAGLFVLSMSNRLGVRAPNFPFRLVDDT